MCAHGNSAISRRSFLAALPVIGAGLVTGSAVSRPFSVIDHPDPRPGIDASEVVSGELLAALPEHIQEIYEMIREIPHIADGIGCSCFCITRPTYRSLLTCYYPNGMAMGCNICQSEARLVYGRYKEGQSLEQIRRAIDARFG